MTSYRLDIDGLRAIAVLMVLGFHLKLSAFAGGHVGVDAFFVLSGFLITSILLTQLKRGQFSAKQFYVKRIKRLFPALFTTIFLTFFASAFILQPIDFERFSRSAVASVFSVSNIVFWAESGYWDVASETKPLLHTWSLGVEEQFYLLWPALLLFLFTRNLHLFRSLLLITLGGIGFCYFYSDMDISGAFYLLPSRVFQFSCGALLAVQVSNYKADRSDNRMVRGIALISGLSLLIYSCLSLDESVLYPGFYALLPTVGTYLVLMSGSGRNGQGMIGKLLLQNPVMVWVGQISYSLYLVHWPIIVLYRYATDAVFSPVEILLLLVIIFIAAVFLHYGVEKKFYSERFRRKSTDKTVAVRKSLSVSVVLSSGVLLSIVATHGWLSGGWGWRFDQLRYDAFAIKEATDARVSFHEKACWIHQWPDQGSCEAKEVSTALFLGNSHEPDGYNFMRAAYPKAMQQLNVVNFGTINGCDKLGRDKQGVWHTDSKGCQLRVDRLLDRTFVTQLDIVIVTAHHTFKPWNENIWRIIEDLKTINDEINVVVIGDYLQTETPCVNVLNKTGATDRCFVAENVAYNPQAENQNLFRKYSPLIDAFIDRMDLLCSDSEPQSCASTTPEGVPYSFDQHHNSLEFAAMSGEKFSQHVPDLFGVLQKRENSEALLNSLGLVPKLDGVEPPANPDELRIKIQQLYIGFLGRAADKAGQEYWLNEIVDRGMSLDDLSNALSDPNQAEFKSIYAGMDSLEKIQTVYKNLLGRSPKTQELHFWEVEFSAGQADMNRLVNDILVNLSKTNASGLGETTDQKILDNKVRAATHFTEKSQALTFDAETSEMARRVISEVDESPDKLAYSKQLTDRYTAIQ